MNSFPLISFISWWLLIFMLLNSWHFVLSRIRNCFLYISMLTVLHYELGSSLSRPYTVDFRGRFIRHISYKNSAKLDVHIDSSKNRCYFVLPLSSSSVNQSRTRQGWHSDHYVSTQSKKRRIVEHLLHYFTKLFTNFGTKARLIGVDSASVSLVNYLMCGHSFGIVWCTRNFTFALRI